MASATLDHGLDEEVGSYWSKEPSTDDSKPRRTSKMLERMSSTRPWLRRRISRKASQSSLHSTDADAVSQTFSTHTQWAEATDDAAYDNDAEGESCEEGARRQWMYGKEDDYSSTSLDSDTRTFADASDTQEIEGFFDRSEVCHGAATSLSVSSTDRSSTAPSPTTETSTAENSEEQPRPPLSLSPSAASQSSTASSSWRATADSVGDSIGSWARGSTGSLPLAHGSTGSLPLALASYGRKLTHVAKAGALPCHCPSCCACSSGSNAGIGNAGFGSCGFGSSSGGSSHTLSSCWSGDGAFSRLRSRNKTCPLRSSLEFKAKRSHPGSLAMPPSDGGSVTAMDGSVGSGSGDQLHRGAVRLHSAPGSMFTLNKARSPSACLALGMGLGASAAPAMLARKADDFGSVQTLCQERALVEEDEYDSGVRTSSSPPPPTTTTSRFWLDGRVYKDRVRTMLDWFDEFSDQQRNLFLERLLDSCSVSQMHYLSTALEPVLHESCPHNCQDLLSWLPMTISWHILSFLDPVSLCRASQVSTAWYELATEPVLWRTLSKMSRWKPSEFENQRLINLYTCGDTGFVDWKHVFSEMYRLRRNWLQGRFTVRTFAGHTSGISCVQFDDTRIVSGSSDRTIKVWDIRTNTPWCALTLVGHSATVRCLHLRGNQLVSGSADCTIKVWDLSMDASGCWSSAACRVTMIGHLHTVRCLKVDDTKVVSGSYDMSLKVWDLKSGICLNTLHGHTGAVICLQYDEERIVSGSADNTIKVWRLGDGECLMTLVGHQDAVTCLQFDSEKIISGSVDCAIKFWSIETGQCIQTLDWIRSEGHRGVVRDLQADKWKIVSAADDKTLKVWSIGKGQRLLTLHCHTDGVTCLQFNDRRIVSGSYDKTVKLYDFSAC